MEYTFGISQNGSDVVVMFTYTCTLYMWNVCNVIEPGHTHM